MIKQCVNLTYIKSFLLLPEVARYAFEHGAVIEDEALETDDRLAWLSFVHDDNPIGLIKFHLVSGCAAMFHPYILREHKDLYGLMVQEFFQWFAAAKQSDIIKLNVAIPSKFKNTIRAAIDAGMTLEGTDRLSYLSKDGPCDRMLLGVTREELIK